MPLPSDIEALDIGCGDGKSTLAIAQKLEIEGAVVGIDKNVAKLPTAVPDPNISFHGVDMMDRKAQLLVARHHLLRFVHPEQAVEGRWNQRFILHLCIAVLSIEPKPLSMKIVAVAFGCFQPSHPLDKGDLTVAIELTIFITKLCQMLIIFKQLFGFLLDDIRIKKSHDR